LDKYPGDTEQDIDVLFTGSYLPWATERTETLRAVDKFFNLDIYSYTPDAWKAEGFKNVFGPKMDDELPYLYARAKIVLSIDHTIEAGYWSDRNAQIMACGGNVLFRYVPLSEATFKDHVHYFYDINDCLEQITNGIPHAEDSYEYAQNNLKVINRVQDLLTIVKGIL
jgi:spore maturation protein CgeB